MCDTWDVGNLRQAGLGLPAETADKDRPEAWASTFGLTIARPQSRVVVGQDSPQLCECQIPGAAIVQVRLVQPVAPAATHSCSASWSCLSSGGLYVAAEPI